MPNLEDYLSDLGMTNQNKKQKPMWGEVIPKMEDSGGGILDTLGSLAQVGGTVATLAGQPEIGIPLSMAGGAVSGGSKEGVTGALKGGIISGGKGLTSTGLDKTLDVFRTPVDTGAMSAFSSKGAPLTVPGIRKNPIEVFSSQGSPMTVPASPKTWAGGS